MATGPSVTKLSLFNHRLPRTLGFGAGLLACALLVYGVAGALWGLFRPTLTGHEVDDGGYAIDAMGNAQFIAFITFASTKIGAPNKSPSLGPEQWWPCALLLAPG